LVSRKDVASKEEKARGVSFVDRKLE
jgi:hypothetical protein